MQDDPVGIPGEESVPRLQPAAFAELVNKLAWALGSAYRVPYQRHSRDPRRFAINMAREFVKEHGWPKHTQKD